MYPVPADRLVTAVDQVLGIATTGGIICAEAQPLAVQMLPERARREQQILGATCAAEGADEGRVFVEARIAGAREGVGEHDDGTKGHGTVGPPEVGMIVPPTLEVRDESLWEDTELEILLDEGATRLHQGRVVLMQAHQSHEPGVVRVAVVVALVDKATHGAIQVVHATTMGILLQRGMNQVAS